jgi:parvulin-like peptidyl-prolyl isomerase
MAGKLTILIIWFAVLAAVHAEPVLAKSGEIELTATDLREVVSGLDAGQRAALEKDPAALGAYVRAVLIQRVILRQAEERQWDREPAVAAKLVRARESALAESFLVNVAAVEEGYPSEEELKAAYETAKPQLLVPRSFRLAQIFISGDKVELDGVLKQLKAKGADFSAIAAANSDETASAAKGGEIGWVTEEQVQPELRGKLSALKLGAVSEPIKLKDGWHILKMVDIREANTPTLDQIRSQLAARLRAERGELIRKEYVAKLVRENPVAINEIEISKIIGPAVKP